MKLILVLGGARSGKSAYAQQLAENLGQRVLFVATATAGDEEMAERIERHRAVRPPHWRTLEAPLGIGRALEAAIADAEVVLMDCLTLLVSNWMMEEGERTPADRLEALVKEELEAIMKVCEEREVTLIVVSNEVGMGLVPPYPMGRVFRDVLGQINQWLAARADRVVLMVAGIPLELKGPAAK
ncbi:MAG: bifunctional adenosylcobinamide kinase/adenosylcobinamide-phosphate guanylyltransferase [Anaerolineae bacterium]|nr:bifunctional adenosylcobinamide kinase/adenosylcobinamide-phosphate guanylyltransferase [Anaerolineae bacterium]MDW8102580.1 bifunctional adenosylcobinamide kinase/adenosylcobinamide-phosphate guanylyltransferase [Anaerolineae bacterium]